MQNLLGIEASKALPQAVSFIIGVKYSLSSYKFDFHLSPACYFYCDNVSKLYSVHFPNLLNPGLTESLRLSDGQSRCDGRVEISLDGMWSRVLDDDWNIKDAHVVCRQLQCGIAKRAYYLPRSERGIGPVGLRSVHCDGNETQLLLCKTSHSQVLSAGVAEDVGVICSGELLCEKNRMLSRVVSSQPCAVVSPDLK